jgi:hypothetical protein
MIYELKRGYDYTFLRYSEKDRVLFENYGYIGEVLSDSWGSGEPKDRLMWDVDINSFDFWDYFGIYPELVSFVNKSLDEGYELFIGESKLNEKTNDIELKPGDKIYKNFKEKTNE